MWISTRAQYGLRALIEIGRQPGQPVSLKEVSARQDISLHYLEQIVGGLRRAGFVQSVRGARGGYQLARAPGQINAYEVVTALEGSIAPVQCVEDNHTCDSQNVCGTQDLWFRVDAALRDVLGGTTLADLIEQSERQQHSRLVQIEGSYSAAPGVGGQRL